MFIMSLILQSYDGECIKTNISEQRYFYGKQITCYEYYDTYKNDIIALTSLISDIVDIIINYINKEITCYITHVPNTGVKITNTLYEITINYKLSVVKLIQIDDKIATCDQLTILSDIYDMRKHNKEIRNVVNTFYVYDLEQYNDMLTIYDLEQYNDMLAICKLIYDIIDDVL